MNLTEIQTRIQNAEVVSFDIFDTLLVRAYRRPTDLFRHLEESRLLPGFQHARIAAEQATRREAEANGVHEVTLQQIYEHMHATYAPCRTDELELEKLMCRANPEMQQVFAFARRTGKRIFIASDMYLPGEVIRELLSRNGYEGYEKLFLSSETLRPKATGEMYEDMLAAAGVSADRLLHIGDNAYADEQIAAEHHLATYRYEPISDTCGDDRNSAYFAVLNQYAKKEVAASILEGLIAENCANTGRGDYWAQFGFRYVGVIAYSYMQWLKSRLDAAGIKKAYFMLRDGYVMKRVFDELYPDFETHEIFGSRRMFLFAGMENYSDIRFNVSGIHTKGIRFCDFWNRLALKTPELQRRFANAFPEQEQRISSDADVERLNSFLEQNEEALRSIGKAERENLLAYFHSIALFDGESAIVDLGWKGTMLKGISNIYRMSGRKDNFIGFYLGTHSCDTEHLRVESFLLDHGESTGAGNADVLKNYGYVIPILELAFSAPHPSILKLRATERGMEPVYQTVNHYEEDRMCICEHILKGVLAFTRAMKQLERYPVSISRELALAPLEYFSEHVSRQDEYQIGQVYASTGIGNENLYRPISKHGIPTFGIINTFPGDMSAELEIVYRVRKAAEASNMRCIMLENNGYILDAEQKSTGKIIGRDDLDFVITTHYETPKEIDSFYYHTLWNPPEIPLNVDYYVSRVANNYLMNDDYLICEHENGIMTDHLQSVLLNKKRTLKDASIMTTSFPMCSRLAPKLDDPVMFYCGMNWEAVVHNTNRHNGLFKLLDRTKKIRFYGPDTVTCWGGVKPWAGYQCYQYPIPFDGFSILKEINECGICLVLSSDVHRRAGMTTTRAYEACAAGAVIISDDNPFMLRYFKDAALFIVYNKNDPHDTYRQIMEKYEWIVAHREEALELAKRAQRIFTEKFALELQLQKIVENHPLRQKQIARNLFALDNSKRVLVLYVLNTLAPQEIAHRLTPVIQNVQNQIYPNIRLAIAADETLCAAAAEFCELHCAAARVIPMQLYDKKGSKKLTDGQAIRDLQKRIPHDFCINTTADEWWFCDHVTTLVRAVEDDHSMCAYSGTLSEDIMGNRSPFFFESLTVRHLYSKIADSACLPAPGQFLFTSEADELLPDFLFSCLDGKEHYAYANFLRYKCGAKLSFSKRMTLVFRSERGDARNLVLSDDKQSRFIQDLVRFDLPDAYQESATVVQEANLNSGAATAQVAELLLITPIKNLLKLRYYQFRMRKLDHSGSRYKAIERKYQQTLSAYHQFFNMG